MRGCLVLDRLLSIEKGELTRNLKFQRDEIERVHHEDLNALYAGFQGGREAQTVYLGKK